MLERASWLPAVSQPDIARTRDNREFFTHVDILRFLRRHYWIMAIATLSTVAMAGLYVFFADPIFTARAQLVIDPKMPQLLREQTGEVNFSLDGAQVESQLAVLRSEKIATMVINQLNLREKPEFRGEKGSKAANGKPSASQPPSDGVLARISSFFGFGERPKLPEFEQSRIAMGVFAGGLDVRRVGLSYAIEISFSARDPDLAAQIANATANAYVHDQVDAKSQAARQGSEWLEERISQLREQLNAATRRVQEFRVRHDYRIPEKQKQPGDAETRREHTLEELETAAESYRKIYESYLQAFAASVQRQSFPVADARIITLATRPLSKSRPRTTLILAFGALAGLMAGFGIALVRHNLDRSVRTSQQIREELGLECLGMIPRISSRRRSGHFDEVARAPFSRFSNGLKSVKAAISLANKTKSMRCIGITSALPKEGKSTVASNLATLFSMSGSRTLVIDADLYRSTLTKRFAPHTTVGLIEALQDPDPEMIKQRVVPAGAASYDLLPAVPKPIVNSTEILGSHRMQALLQALYQSYDIVIFDLPPLSPVVDTLAISHHLDGVVVVIEWGATSIDTISEVSRSLRTSKTPILGVAMTKVDANSVDSYGKHDALYYR